MTEPMTFPRWLLKKLIEHGHSGGGIGWMRYWIMGLFAVVIYDVSILHVQISWVSVGYVCITLFYLLIRGVAHLWRRYIKEVYGVE